MRSKFKGASPDWNEDFDRYYKCLESLCPEGVRCDLEGDCHFEMANIDQNGHWNYKGTGYVYVEKGNFASNEQRHALFELVVNALKKQVQEPKNCYHVEKVGDVDHMCNIGSRFQARISGAGRYGAYGALNVLYQFSDRPAPGPYDCEGSKGAIDGFMKQTTAPRLSKVHKLPFFDTIVTCRGNEW
jgi:hypothetical protein